VAGNFASSMANNHHRHDAFSAATITKGEAAGERRPTRAIRPYQLKNGREYFVLFRGQQCVPRFAERYHHHHCQHSGSRPVKANGMDKNPLFQDGDLIYNGIIIREVPELDIRLPTFYTTGRKRAAIQVAPCFMCGQSAMAFAWGRASDSDVS